MRLHQPITSTLPRTADLRDACRRTVYVLLKFRPSGRDEVAVGGGGRLQRLTLRHSLRLMLSRLELAQLTPNPLGLEVRNLTFRTRPVARFLVLGGRIRRGDGRPQASLLHDTAPQAAPARPASIGARLSPSPA